jgi:hypothetical protein
MARRRKVPVKGYLTYRRGYYVAVHPYMRHIPKHYKRHKK